ncbi:MAG TPA: glycosyltransferase family 9 protein [Candidatus Binatia bacterium]|nr:glycosyltransferase family 9 protein [Candidatus Binatia bacterium]
MPEVSPSVLIIRLDGIGDALALAPLLAALRRRVIPVDVVARRSNAGVFAAAAARRIIVADFELRSSSAANLGRIDELGRSLRAHDYSHVLVATEDPGGYRLAGAVAAPTRIGFSNGWGKPFKSLWARRFLTATIYRSAGVDRRARHECDVLFGLGAPLIGEERPTKDASELRTLVLEREPQPDERVAVQITTKWERLDIPLEHVVELVRRLAASAELRLLSARAEAPYAERVAQATDAAIDYFDDLVEWKAAIGAAPALVAPDSGAMHVAGTVGTPVVGVFPPGRNFALQVDRWAPWAARHRIVGAGDCWPERAAGALADLLSV